eukprot:Gb_06517 [translate_table: standard]
MATRRRPPNTSINIWKADAALQKLPIITQFAKPSYTGKTSLDMVKANLKYIFSSMLSSLNLSVSASAAVSGPLNVEGIFVIVAICPIHGPVVRYAMIEFVGEYNAWTQQRLSRQMKQQ